MSEDKREEVQEQPKKRGRGHPPWTEEQKEARRKLIAEKQRKKGIEERRAETKYEADIRRSAGILYRDGQGGPWSQEMRDSYNATLAKRRAKRDKEIKELIKANPHKTLKQLGVNDHWKPYDGSPSGYYGIALRQARVGISLPVINIKNPNEVRERIEQYFDFCESQNRPPNLIGLANWIGINRMTLEKWKRGDFSADNQVGPIIQAAASVIEEALVAQVQENPKSMIGGMFLLKSMFHYREQSEVAIVTGQQSDSEMSPDEIRKRYLGDGKVIDGELTDPEKE